MDAAISVYEQYCEQVRHHQDERRAIASTLTVIIGALVAVAAIDQRLDEQDLSIAYAFVAMGLFGAACMIKCHALIRFYKEMALIMALHIGKGEAKAFDVKSLGNKVLNDEPGFWKVVHKVRLWQLWLLFFMFVMFAGIWLWCSLPSNGWILVRSG
ncbi:MULTISPECIES: hypothetical protein [unclassified Pseudomonas]|uniref:hypothetical protein n=1 Tax=unclassified Pseudomonas TaxID=196821 RepID=UPI0024896F23|nr:MULTISPECIES: hypothetical protein [unclassified Pseudomonas]MDI1331752.1 hypothetical protein [Pseudomonas sp.]WNF54628.1 hypothetical protein RHP74_25470 [Pseudomonas sp. SG20052]